MASLYNLDWVRTEVASKINFNLGELEQDFDGSADDQWKKIDSCINEAQSEEWNKAKNETNPEYFLASTNIVWGTGLATLTIPNDLVDQQLYEIRDITNGSPGTLLWVFDSSKNEIATVTILSRNQLAWGNSGPGYDATLNITFTIDPIEMRNGTDVPLIPFRHRWLLVNSASIVARERADEQAPIAWMRTRENQRRDMYFDMFKGRVCEPARPSIVTRDGGINS